MRTNRELLDIEGFVLAGGESRRMGVSKCGLMLGGLSAVERAVAALTGVTGGRVSVAGSRGESGPWPVPVVGDPVTLKNGQPVRASIIGLQSALLAADSEWVAVLACDLPFITSALFERLKVIAIDGLNADDAVEAIVPIQPDGRLQPLCAIYRRTTTLQLVTQAISSDDWSLMGLLKRLRLRKVQFAEISGLPGSEHFFLNMNTPADHSRAQTIANEL